MPIKWTVGIECAWCGINFLPPPGPPRKYCGERCAKEALVVPLDEKLWSHVVKGDGCWEWQGPQTPFGHGHLGHRGKRLYAHRVSWELHYGPIPKGMNVCHRCDNPPCVRPAHLMLGTHRDNARDMAMKGRQGLHRDPTRAVRGERHHRARLTDALVREIRGSTESSVKLAARMGVSKPTILRVRHGKTWAHVV